MEIEAYILPSPPPLPSPPDFNSFSRLTDVPALLLKYFRKIIKNVMQNHIARNDAS